MASSQTTIRFVTIVTEDFWPGFAALVESISRNSMLLRDEFEFLVICDIPNAPGRWLETRNEKIELFPIANLNRVEILSRQLQGKRMEEALQKLAIFSLPSADRKWIYIDSDIICLSSLRDALNFEPMAAATDHLTGFDIPEAIADAESDVNTGFLVFQPDESIHKNLVATYQTNPDAFFLKGDQDVFNRWNQGKKMFRLGSEWNFSKRFQDKVGCDWIKERLSDIKLLHFVATKPWTNNASVYSLSECRYYQLERIWWNYFRKSGIGPFLSVPPSPSSPFFRQYIIPFIRRSLLMQHLSRFKENTRESIRHFMGKNPGIKNRLAHYCRTFLNWIQHPSPAEVHRINAEKSAHLIFTDSTVRSGPFSGMKYPAMKSHGSAIFAKLLGAYEAELHETIEKLVREKPPVILDIGCAEGYYAVGLGMRLHESLVVASDISKLAQAMCLEMAKVNGVHRNFEIAGPMSAEKLRSYSKHPTGAVFCDCEGAERHLLTPEVFSSLAGWIFIVELHEFIEPGIEHDLPELAAKTHDISIIESIDDYRRLDSFPLEFVAHLPREQRFHLYREGRPNNMKWLVARPRQ